METLQEALCKCLGCTGKELVLGLTRDLNATTSRGYRGMRSIEHFALCLGHPISRHSIEEAVIAYYVKHGYQMHRRDGLGLTFKKNDKLELFVPISVMRMVEEVHITVRQIVHDRPSVS